MKISEVLRVILKHPVTLIQEGIRAAVRQEHRVSTERDHGRDRLPTISLLDLMSRDADRLRAYSFLSGTSTVPDLILLRSLARRFPECVYLEIGSWRGESLAAVADVAAECIAVTLSEDQLRERGYPVGFIDAHGSFTHGLSNVRYIGADSMKYDFSLLDKNFDLIFIDGNHSYEAIVSDTRGVLPLLRDSGSALVWHDYGFDAETVRFSTLRAILDAVPKDQHRFLYHVSNTMCAVYLPEGHFERESDRIPSPLTKVFSLDVSVRRTLGEI